MSRPIRAVTYALSPYVIYAVKKDVSIPTRELAITILKTNIDAMLNTQQTFRKKIENQIPAIINFMQKHGYETTKPKTHGETAKKLCDWILENTVKKDDENIIDYLDRVALFLARILAVGGIITMGDFDESIGEIKGLVGIEGVLG